MNYTLIFFILFSLVNGEYYLYLKKCDFSERHSVAFLRYQYDEIHYPQYCPNEYTFDENYITTMLYNLDMDWFSCDSYINDNITKFDKNLLYWKSIWLDFGTCTHLSPYYYFNRTLQIFYWWESKFYDCHNDNVNCKQKFDDNLSLIDSFSKNIISYI